MCRASWCARRTLPSPSRCCASLLPERPAGAPFVLERLLPGLAAGARQGSQRGRHGAGGTGHSHRHLQSPARGSDRSTEPRRHGRAGTRGGAECGGALQARNADVPLILSAVASIIDMRTSASLTASPEIPLMSVALLEVVHSLGAPALAGVAVPDADALDMRAGLEAMGLSLPVWLMRPDIAIGMGGKLPERRSLAQACPRCGGARVLRPCAPRDRDGCGAVAVDPLRKWARAVTS